MTITEAIAILIKHNKSARAEYVIGGVDPKKLLEAIDVAVTFLTAFK